MSLDAPLYRLEGASLSYGSIHALRDVTLQFRKSEFVAVAGPNGAGKSTLLNVMAGLRPGYSGRCLYEGIELAKWTRSQFARRVSVVPQSVRIEFPFTAEQVVLMGRTPFADAMFESDEDASQVRRAMELTGTTAFGNRDFQTLSGGEKQRVILASALAQTPQSLLLDEPTTYLDIEHQIALYRLLRTLSRDGVLVITVTHDLNLASTFADRIVLLAGGTVVADGTPNAVMQPATMRDVFRVDTIIQRGPSGRPWITYGS
ncbi:MAG: ABC transporter ATP-binding protein [Bryobacteraceae bacterium]|nr:ABC transporter ATP-binding protein [Bryobacteraceae bacterium]